MALVRLDQLLVLILLEKEAGLRDRVPIVGQHTHLMAPPLKHLKEPFSQPLTYKKYHKKLRKFTYKRPCNA